VSYVFDTSGNTSGGENAGPTVISRQVSGASLFASVGKVTQGGGPGLALNSVADRGGDARYVANGHSVYAGKNLDLLGASLVDGPHRTLIARIKLRSLKSLAASATIGGPDASWMLRWTFYVGMDNNAGGKGKATFFAGSTSSIPPANPQEHAKYLTFPQTHLLKASAASFNTKTGVITIRVPRIDVGNPARGTVLLSVTAFTTTSTSPQSATTIFNQIDATTPFDHTM
jgi:hypothetical protein